MPSSRLDLTLKGKISLILSGIVFSLVLLELGLRLGGFITLSAQEHRNRQAIKQKGAYRILCLGESTTQNQYPRFLEQFLNKSNIGVHFSVVDKGKTGADTPSILREVEFYLVEYRPDMVVTMMGINDEQIKYYRGIGNTVLFQKSRVYRWLQFIYKLIREKRRMAILDRSLRSLQADQDVKFDPDKMGKYFALGVAYYNQGQFLRSEEIFKKCVQLNPENSDAYIELGQIYQKQGQFLRAEEILKKCVEFNPGDVDAYIELGQIYQNHGQFSQAEEIMEKWVQLNPEDSDAYIKLGEIYQRHGKFSRAEDILKKGIKVDPKNYVSYFALGVAYRDHGKFSRAESTLKKLIELDPGNGGAYIELGQIYQGQRQLSQAEDIFKKGTAADPNNVNVYAALAWLYRSQGRFSRAEEIFKKYIELHPENYRAYGAIVELYKEMGKPALVKKYAQKVSAIRLGHYSSVSVKNYHRLKEILEKKGIRLVCAQYPMNSVEPLKRVFEGDEEGIIFVDNEGIFVNAVKKDGYSAYFGDMFGGNFGHCTDKGNKLIAKSIANRILKEVFSN